MKMRLALLGLLWSAGVMAADTVRIGVVCPFSGGSSPMGVSMRNGVRLAASEINFIGGLLGKPVELVERDDEATPSKGQTIARELIDKEKVVAVVGFCNTGVALASQPVYQSARIPMLNNVATGVAITQQFRPPEHPVSYVFRNSASDVLQADMISREAIEQHRFSRVAILHDTTAYGRLGRDALLADLSKRKIKPVAIESFDLGARDLLTQVRRAKDAGAEVLLTYSVGPELAAVAQAKQKLGWNVQMIGSWPLSWPNFIGPAGAAGEGARMPQTFIEEATDSRRTGFILSYYRENKVDRMQSALSAAQGYDSMLLLAAAIRQAGNLDGAAIRDALENLKGRVPGVVTDYEKPFSPDNHEAIGANVPVMGEVRNGRVVYAYGEDEKRSLVRRGARY